MALPKQVQAQLAEIEEIEKTLKAPSKEKKAKKPETGSDGYRSRSINRGRRSTRSC